MTNVPDDAIARSYQQAYEGSARMIDLVNEAGYARGMILHGSYTAFKALAQSLRDMGQEIQAPLASKESRVQSHESGEKMPPAQRTAELPANNSD